MQGGLSRQEVKHDKLYVMCSALKPLKGDSGISAAFFHVAENVVELSMGTESTSSQQILRCEVITNGVNNVESWAG